jgi:glycosyltransferase involved in cell wall biosynthesis
MKALLVSGIYSPDIGGPATYLPKLAAALLREGHVPTVFSLAETSGKARKEEPWNRIFLNRQLKFPIRFLKGVKFLIGLIAENDVVFSNGLYEEVGIASLFRRKRMIAKVVGDPIWERFRNSTGSKITIDDFNKSRLSFRYRLQRSFFVWSLNRHTKVICPSKQLCILVVSWGVYVPVKFIPNSTSEVSVSASPKTFDLVTVSRLVSWKNIDLLIEASAKCKLRLAIAGDGPDGGKLKALAKELGADVTFLGNLQDEEVIQLLADAEIFALLSDYEGQSFALLQAMMSGVKILVSKIPGNLDTIIDGETGIVVEAKSLDSLLVALKRLRDLPNGGQELASAARRTAEKKYSDSINLPRMVTELFQQENIGLVVVDPRGVVGDIDRSAFNRQVGYLENIQAKMKPTQLNMLILSAAKQPNATHVEFEKSTISLSRISRQSRISLVYIYRAIKVLRKLDYKNIIYISGDPWESWFNSFIISKIYPTQSKIQVQVHGDFLNEDWIRLSITNKIRSQILQFTLRHSDSVRYVSQPQYETFQNIIKSEVGKSFIAPVPLNTDFSTVCLHLENRKKNFGVLSRLSEDRGLSYVLSFIEEMNKADQGFELIVGGSGPLKENFLQQAETILGGERVKYLGEIAANEIETFWAQVGVYLSFAPTESYGRSIREAAVHGIPIIAKTSSGVSSLISENKGVVIHSMDLQKITKQSIENALQLFTCTTTGEYFEFAKENSKKSVDTLTDTWLDLLGIKAL